MLVYPYVGVIAWLCVRVSMCMLCRLHDDVCVGSVMC